jgi:Mrp family chromosome partitioning ATPase
MQEIFRGFSIANNLLIINDSSKNYDLVIIDGPAFQTSWDLFAVAKISE